MTPLAISVEELSKQYHIGRARSKSSTDGAASSLGDRLLGRLGLLRPTMNDEVFWALKDVSFDVGRGEVVGLIGRNGAGKSTLLKLLARITEPTSGRAVINGRVGSLLEVGTGFHPELTGRENVYLSGAVLGMRRTEIERKFDEIVAFAEVERFLETPVKRYSSGMYVRLAFAVAAHLEPEILLVDEVLAVGDAAFQKKCLGKMGDVATQGRTVLFVSHNMVAIQNLCQRVIWLGGGEMVECGETNDVIARYLSAARQAQTERVWEPEAAPGNDVVRVRRVCVRPQGAQPEDIVTMTTPLEVEVEFWNPVPGAQLHACWHVYTEQQVVAFATAANEDGAVAASQPLPIGLVRSTVHIPGNLLNEGLHRLSLLILRNTSKIAFRLDEALVVEVLDTGKRPGTWYGREPGAVRPRLKWETEVMEATESVNGQAVR